MSEHEPTPPEVISIHSTAGWELILVVSSGNARGAILVDPPPTSWDLFPITRDVKGGVIIPTPDLAYPHPTEREWAILRFLRAMPENQDEK